MPELTYHETLAALEKAKAKPAALEESMARLIEKMKEPDNLYDDELCNMAEETLTKLLAAEEEYKELSKTLLGKHSGLDYTVPVRSSTERFLESTRQDVVRIRYVYVRNLVYSRKYGFHVGPTEEFMKELQECKEAYRLRKENWMNYFRWMRGREPTLKDLVTSQNPDKEPKYDFD